MHSSRALHPSSSFIRLLHAILLVGIISLFSCNSIAKVVFSENDKVDMDVIINFSPYFNEYTKDLLGYSVFSDIILVDDVKTYLLQKEAVTNVNVGIHNDPVRLLIRLSTDDLPATLKDLGVSYTKQGIATNMTYLSLKVNSEFFLQILETFPRLEDIPLAAFITPKSHIPKEQWPQYISWSLEEYAPRDEIESDLMQSGITLIVDRPNPQLPDRGWLGFTGDTRKQQKTISLIDFLYGDGEEIALTY